MARKKRSPFASFVFVFILSFFLGGWLFMPFLSGSYRPAHTFFPEYWLQNWAGLILGLVLGLLSARSIVKEERAIKEERAVVLKWLGLALTVVLTAVTVTSYASGIRSCLLLGRFSTMCLGADKGQLYFLLHRRHSQDVKHPTGLCLTTISLGAPGSGLSRPEIIERRFQCKLVAAGLPAWLLIPTSFVVTALLFRRHRKMAHRSPSLAANVSNSLADTDPRSRACIKHARLTEIANARDATVAESQHLASCRRCATQVRRQS